jgi:hypothetical protein
MARVGRVPARGGAGEGRVGAGEGAPAKACAGKGGQGKGRDSAGEGAPARDQTVRTAVRSQFSQDRTVRSSLFYGLHFWA